MISKKDCVGFALTTSRLRLCYGVFVKGVAARLVLDAPFDAVNKLDLYHKSRKALTFATERVPANIVGPCGGGPCGGGPCGGELARR